MVVVGLGLTGFSVVDTLVELGCDVLAVAAQATPERIELTEVIGSSALVTEQGSHRAEAAVNFAPEWAVVSPGVSLDDPVVLALKEAGVPLISDVDLAWRLRDKNHTIAQWVMVSGGGEREKIAQLAARVLNAAGTPTLVVGEGHGPLLDALRDPHPYETLIIVASPASLAWWERFHDHSRRPLMAVSIQDDAEDSSGVLFDGVCLACVYRRGSGTTEDQVHDAEVVEGARAIGVGLDSPGRSDLGLVEGILVDRAFLEDRANQAWEISTLDELVEAGWTIPEELPGILAAVAISRAHDVPPDVIAGVLSLP